MPLLPLGGSTAEPGGDAPQRLRRRCAAVLMVSSASFLVHGITESSNGNHYYAVMAAFSFLVWMAGVALLLFSFLAQFDEQPDVVKRSRLLRGCATSAMVLAASVLVHGIPESGGNANHHGAAVMAGCFFLLWMAGVALLLLSLVL